MKKELNILTTFLKETGLNNREIADKVGISAVSIGKIFEGQFPSKSISSFFAAFPELSPMDVYGHYSNGSYKEVSVDDSEIEKENAELKKSLKNAEASNSLLRLVLNGKLSQEEKTIANFNSRNQRSTAKQIFINRKMEKVTLSVTHSPKRA